MIYDFLDEMGESVYVQSREETLAFLEGMVK